MRKLSIFLVIGILLFTEGCKKYPEGPLISLQSAFQRVRGKWDVERFLVNQDDSTDAIKEYPYYCQMNFQGGLKDDPQVTNDYSFNVCIVWGTWMLKEDNRILLIELDKDTSIVQNYGPFLAPGPIYWTIQKLTSKKMWLSTNYNNKEYYVKFKSINSY